MDPATRCSLCMHREDEHETLPDGSRPCRSIGHEKGLTCRECIRLTGAEHVEAVIALRGADDEAFRVAWAAYYATLNHVRDQIGPGWQAFFSDVHQSALASAVLVLREQQAQAGIPGTVVDAILCDAATVAENVAEGLRRHHEFERSTGALDVMTELHRLAGCGVPPDQHQPRQPFRGPNLREAAMVVRGMDTDPSTQAAADELLRMATEADAIDCTGCGGTGACAGGPCAHPAAVAVLPPPADRPAVLHEAADAAFALDFDELRARTRFDSHRQAWELGTIDAADKLRRLAADAEAAAANAHPASTAPLASGLPLVKGNCPSCGSASLFLGDGGYVTCSRIDCTAPDAASTTLGA